MELEASVKDRDIDGRDHQKGAGVGDGVRVGTGSEIGHEDWTWCWV